MKHERWRRDASAYPFQTTLLPRWSDLDTVRHLNNVALVGLHLEVRQRWIAEVLGLSGTQAHEPELRALNVCTDFVAQAHYPAPLLAAAKLIAVDGTQFELATALFQEGHCVGLQTSRLAVWREGRPAPLPADIAARLYECDRGVPAQTLAPLASVDLEHEPPKWYPMNVPYRDLDAHDGIGELALAHMVEQTRMFLLKPMRTPHRKAHDGRLVLVAHLQVRPLLKVSGFGENWTMGAGVVGVGHSSIRVRSWMRDPREHVVATADTVLVCTDLDTQRPVAMSADMAEAFSELTIRPSREEYSVRA
jgi:acyl-CoA thioesterase FadM